VDRVVDAAGGQLDGGVSFREHGGNKPSVHGARTGGGDGSLADACPDSRAAAADSAAYREANFAADGCAGHRDPASRHVADSSPDAIRNDHHQSEWESGGFVCFVIGRSESLAIGVACWCRISRAWTIHRPG
jgi:hypothetical protein